MYEMDLVIENAEHTEVNFEQFVQAQGKDICPEHGVITYLDGKAQCSAHTEENDEGNVPYL
jgi:hypothetical protein